jgi:hypothetical protein
MTRSGNQDEVLKHRAGGVRVALIAFVGIVVITLAILRIHVGAGTPHRPCVCPA